MIAVCAIAAQPEVPKLGCKLPPRPGFWPVIPANMNKSDASPATNSLTKELVVQNKMGIHARPAAMIVRITNKFKAEVFVEKDDEQVNGKSIMGLMMLAAGKGSKVKFIATGDDAPNMLAEIDALFARKFDEA
jgi:phosphocarrier protein HPr